MKRIDQFQGLGNIFDEMFESVDIKEFFRSEIKKAHNDYLIYEIFGYGNFDYEYAQKAIARVEFLQRTVEKYLQKNSMLSDLNSQKFCGIGLIYEMCSRILTVINNNIEGIDGEMRFFLQNSLLYNTFMTIVFYGCGGETAMAQIIANTYYEQIRETTNHSTKNTLEFQCIEFLNITPDNAKFHGRSLDEDFSDVFYNEFGYVSLYISRCLNNFGKMLFNKYIDSIPPHYNVKLQTYFSGRDDKKKVIFLLPGQKEVLEQLAGSTRLANMISLPTGGGKSLVAEIEICKSITDSPEKKIIYIAPTVALCKQVERDLKKRFDLAIDEFTQIIIGFEYDEDEIDANEKILVMTPENFLLKLSRKKIDLNDFSLIVFDEFHNVGNTDDRAINMQIVINLIKQYQKIADMKLLLISAIVSNTDQIAGWLINGGVPCKSNLAITRKEIFVGTPNGLTLIKDINDSSITSSTHRIINFWTGSKGLFVNLKNPHKIMIFTGIKAHIDSKIRLAMETYGQTDVLSNEDIIVKYAKTFLGNGIEGLHIEALKKGIGFSKGGLDSRLQSMILDYYGKNKLKVIVCTSTLLQGMNLDCEYIFCTDMRYGRNNPLMKGDILNLIGRTGRFPYQTDGYIFFHNIGEKQNNLILGLINEHIKFPVERGEYHEGFQSEFEIFLFQRLSIKGFTAEDIGQLSKTDEIMEEFNSVMGEFFLDNVRYRRTINILEQYFKSRMSFIKKHYLDQRFSTTGMSSHNSEILIECYKKLFIYREENIEEIIDSNVFHEIFPKDIFGMLNSLQFNKQSYIFDDIGQKENNLKFSNYILPWVIGSIKHFLTFESDYTSNRYKWIEIKIDYWIYVLKYQCKTFEGYKLFKKYKNKMDFTVGICEYLVEEGFTEESDEENIFFELKMHDIYHELLYDI